MYNYYFYKQFFGKVLPDSLKVFIQIVEFPTSREKSGKGREGLTQFGIYLRSLQERLGVEFGTPVILSVWYKSLTKIHGPWNDPREDLV